MGQGELVVSFERLERSEGFAGWFEGLGAREAKHGIEMADAVVNC